ncbi:MAG: transketolase [Firmicutes bacterium HGW-Firmicutes-1]|jgi:transketolase|nr:MAG: transketolase [Firmicutes bacterium HGW-Firmicutes-1]
MHLDQETINAIRILSVEAIQKANSGHPGLPMGAAPMAYTLWAKQMKHNPKNPKWINRDRFVLSAGHGSMLLYSLLHLFEYGLTMDDIKQFRQLGSKTPGHPEFGHTTGVEMTTGPLGQGIATAVGMALAESYLASKFNRQDFAIMDHYTFALCGDGCLMEGISGEAASLAGTLGLGKLILFYDSNSISIEGNTDIAFRENVPMRFEAYGWQVIEITDGNDTDAIEKAIEAAKKETDKPTLIKVNTLIGYGCPSKQGKAAAHGEPLGDANIIATKEFFGWTEEPFTIPAAVKQHMNEVISNLEAQEVTWNVLYSKYESAHPDAANELQKWLNNEYLEDIAKNEDFWKYEGTKATRVSSYEVLNKLSKIVPNIIGGSADLSPSTKSIMENRGHFAKEDNSGSNLHFGVREHAMAAMANGIALHGGLIPYVAGFFVFSDYMKPSMRLASLMGLPVIYIMTHDSIGVGEDGPTHQPIEQLMMLRSIPNFNVIRPADANETAAAWYSALTSKSTPTALVLSRQNLTQYATTGVGLYQGAYTIKEESRNVELILVASGSEVELIYEASKVLEEKGISTRVVSMPSWKLFEEQDSSYQEAILPRNSKIMAVEAGSTMGWHKYVGSNGKVMGIDTFGASGPANEVYKLMGLTVENVVKQAELLINL